MDIFKPFECVIVGKKVNKKLSRGLKLINKDLNANLKLLFPFSDIVSKNVVIVNGGLTTGLDEASLICLLAEAGFTSIEKIAIIPQKQYCFVCFSNAEEASQAVRNLNGQVKLASNISYPLYLGCVNEVPSVEYDVVFECPPGLKILEEFITTEEEIFLSNLINWENYPSDSSEGSTLKHREVRHFGYEFKYGSNSIDRSAPLEQGIPDELQKLCQRFVNENLISVIPDQLTVNKYFPGQGIPPHVDTHQSFTSEILSLSILGGITMDFYCHLNHSTVNEHNNIENQDLHYAVYMPQRSLCVMSGPSRYQWTHGICSRSTDIYPDPVTKYLTLRPRQKRVSFTFRKLREDGLCKCSFPKMCDSQSFKKGIAGERQDEQMMDMSALKLEKEHVLDVYENIADHFSETRHKAWPKVTEFVESQPVGSVLLDIGCGNGKYLSKDPNYYQVGCDTSLNLLGICVERKMEVALSNCLSLPFKSSSFDAVICIAVIHHLASQNRRRKSVEEMVRVLRTGGRALVYVWAMEQKREKLSTYLKQKRSNRREFRSRQSNGQLVNETQLPVNQLSSHEQTSRNGAGVPNGDVYSRENGQEEEGLNVSWENLTVCKEDDNISKSLLIHQNRTEFVNQDMFVPWKIKPMKFHKTKENESSANVSSDAVLTYHRYYHVFKEGELESLFNELPDIKVIKSYYDEGNWCIIVEKTNEEFTGSEINSSLTEDDITEVVMNDEVDSKTIQLLLIHDIEEKAEQLAKFIVSAVSFDSQSTKPKDDVEETLLRCVNAMISKHKDVFLELVAKLNISNETAYISFLTVLNELFERDKTVVTWGRIVALYAFGGQLALYCKENNLLGLQKIIPIFIGHFAKNGISHFVLEEGGWQKLCEIYPKENFGNQIWSLVLWATVGLCLTIIVSSFMSH